MALTSVRYEAPGFGVGELALDGDRVVWHELPTSPGGSRESGAARGVPGGAPFPRHPLAERLVAFFGGEAVTFEDVELALDGLSPFQRSLTRALRGVSAGEVVTYGELAALAGRPGAQRAAGTFCARNRFAIIVPCHRVVAANGLGGFGALGPAYRRRLLALEGVEV